MKNKSTITTINSNISFDKLAIENNDNNNDNTESSDSENEFYIQPDDIEDEYLTYLKETNAIQNTQPLDYWKNNSYKYPILSVLARRYLAIPATSASVERLFSVTSNIITKNRNKLSLNTIKQLISLKNWLLHDIEDLEKEILETTDSEDEED